MPRRGTGDSQVYRLKVTLQGIRPPVWRRLEVDGATSLADLHEVLQIAFGWTDWHLHQFVVDGVAYGAPDPEFGSRLRDERRARLRDVLRRPRARMVYEYDFGDDWHHVIVLEAIEALPAGAQLPRCTGGRRRCPPEDVGGPPGYARLLHVLGDPEHPEHDEYLEWLGDEEFDPEAFDPAEVTAYLGGR